MSNNSSSRKIDPSIIAALIGVVGTIVVTLISINANKQPPVPTPVPTPIIASTNTTIPSPEPTDTVPPGDPTSTPAPATDTPVPTFTIVPPVAIGQDWGQNCISSLWKPFPSTIPTVDNGNGCWKAPVYVFSASNGQLSFLGSRTTSGGQEVYGMFAPLPEAGIVTVTIHLRDLSNVDLWTGVFAEPDINSQGILMTIPAGNVKNRLIVQKEIPSYDNIQKTQMINQGDGFIMTFEFSTLSVRALVNRNLFVTNPAAVPSAQKWLFLGYKGLSGSYRIEGAFLNFELK
jgi:hypothetical protein